MLRAQNSSPNGIVANSWDSSQDLSASFNQQRCQLPVASPDDSGANMGQSPISLRRDLSSPCKPAEHLSADAAASSLGKSTISHPAKQDSPVEKGVSGSLSGRIGTATKPGLAGLMNKQAAADVANAQPAQAVGALGAASKPGLAGMFNKQAAADSSTENSASLGKLCQVAKLCPKAAKALFGSLDLLAD